ncbi:flagellar biosynthesis protein FlaG [Pseudoalteromonas sp. GCY]|uniref:flagellar protein FlaG n=1 Tax=Pseudoalteromonas sp. GCY TaxID=2003316 RepID=UPI000BFED2CD|nr:flagellar protein FlaG [Pseudoalteromonas sp. GCY]PHI36915.1 flagellar biosynthesis protein FlaG [Pseudoalteromonas sp. GCY]QQQ68307.1 flagellar protein FlaG [Pseudoalteromonas sp. GCY]
MKEVQASTPNGFVNHTKPEELIRTASSAETTRAVESTSKTESSTKQSEEQGAVKPDIVEEIKSNLEKLNQFIPVTATNLSFEFDERGDPPVVKVIDTNNDEVIREIPSEEFREMAKALEEFADKVSSRGLLFDKTA